MICEFFKKKKKLNILPKEMKILAEKSWEISFFDIKKTTFLTISTSQPCPTPTMADHS